MSLNRWSLPSRAFAREKTSDDDTNQSSKFLTVHIGDPGNRRRANLSSAFTGLFDKDENRVNSITSDGSRFATEELKPLSTRIENVPSVPRNKFDKIDARLQRLTTPVYPNPKRRVIGNVSPKQEYVPRKDNTSNPSHLNPFAKLLGSNSKTIVSSVSLTRVRSTSSSYPSEGIRSPPDQSLSPQLNTWSDSFISELSPYGTYPVRDNSTKSSASANNTSIQDGRVGQCLMEELAAAGGISDTDTRTTSRDYTSKPLLSDITSISSHEEEEDKSPETGNNSGFVTPIEAVSKAPSSSSQEDLTAMLDGQGSSISAIHGSYPELRRFTRISSSEDYVPFRPSNADSTRPLRPSTDADGTGPTRIRWMNQDKPYNTMPASLLRKHTKGYRTGCPGDFVPPYPEEAQLPELRCKNSNGSSTTLARRIQKFRFGKWIKKVCLRTKVRFDSVINPIPSPKKLGKATLKMQKSRRSKNDRSIHKAKPKPRKTHWRTPKATKKEKKVKIQEGKAHRFIRSLKTKHSIHFPIQTKSSFSHRRANSCPP
ncbi:uncharacterized protein F4822DRAFT_409961 [Hypoxylon trugodes]|uniref:uncharacterized protein n=1 Tax=Hypoxylon trugodes TaxID=326681 RepID=UPI00219FA548|nr:uncharacterized protein F4822DRAFT_409961 [Hypoxylon trugodes]KAI1386396.1 hypothetical protein F4822DRAFT_409961 [Hypoxylon trugodes]